MAAVGAPAPWRDRRLRSHAEFVRAQRAARRVGTPHFTLLIAAQPSPPRPPRLGLVVASRIGTAVRRNRVKRLCRECFRTWSELLPPGVDLIVIARPGAHELGLSDVRAEWRAIERLLRKRAAEALARSAGPHHPPADGPEVRPPDGAGAPSARPRAGRRPQGHKD